MFEKYSRRSSLCRQCIQMNSYSWRPHKIIQSVVATVMNVINTSLGLALKDYSSPMGNNCNPQSEICSVTYPGHLVGRHADSFSYSAVRSRTSEVITDLLLLNFVLLEVACFPQKPAGLSRMSKYAKLAGLTLIWYRN